jgi:two-component system LytT family sensor kinase
MYSSNSIIAKLLDNRYRLIHHVVYISLIATFWFLWSFRSLNSFTDVLKTISYSTTYVVIAYFNIYFLFQRFFIKGKIFGYILISLLTFFTGYFTQQLIYFTTKEAFLEHMSQTGPLLRDMSINAFTFFMFICIGLAFKMLKMWLNSESKLMLLEQDILKAKLSNLKSQVNPHFLFNTFNNLYVLTKTKPALASKMILGLSDLMRYQLNESNVEKIGIEKEIEYIKNLLSLEKIRKDNLELKIDYDINKLNGLTIEPLLFTTLIENAVKHGSQQMEVAFIHVKIEKTNELFTINVTNSKPENAIFGKEESLGLGIENLKSRLKILYPNKHALKLINYKNTFSANLQLEIK